MAAFTGKLASAPIYPASSGINPGAYDSRTASLFPYGGMVSSAPVSGAFSRKEPPPPSFARTGNRATSFLTDYYNHVIVSPAPLALGGVAKPLVETITVWNAHLSESVTLSAINAQNNAGISIATGTLPEVFPPNFAQTFQVDIAAAPPGQIGATYEFVFNTETAAFEITGFRLTAPVWSFRPDASTPTKETLAWKTDVMRGWSGAEMRRAIRIAPRRTFTFSSTVTDVDRRVMETLLFAWSSQLFALPVFTDGQLLATAIAAGALSIPCVTANYDFVAGGLGLLLTDAQTTELFQISTVGSNYLEVSNGTQNAWGAGSRLYPVRQARLLSYPKATRESSTVATIAPTFTIAEPCDWTPISGLPQYRTASVLEFEPDAGNGQEISYVRETMIIDNASGLPEVDDRAGLGFPSIGHGWFMVGAAARATFRSILYALKGKQGALWVPSFQYDIIIEADISGGATLLTIQNIGMFAYLNAVQNRQDIRIELFDGTVFYRRVTSAAEVTPAVEQITIDSILSSSLIPAASIRRVSFMTLCRLAGDAITIDHLGAGVAQAKTVFVGTEQPL